MRHVDALQDPAHSEPLWRLWFRFFWPFRCFRDVTCGTLLERQLNYRHNRAMRVFLPGFIVKWIFLTALWFGFGSVFDQIAGLVIPAACCFMTGSWAFIVVVLLATSWAWLERFPELYDQPARARPPADRDRL